jgi:hypothetical protein
LSEFKLQFAGLLFVGLGRPKPELQPCGGDLSNGRRLAGLAFFGTPGATPKVFASGLSRSAIQIKSFEGDKNLKSTSPRPSLQRGEGELSSAGREIFALYAFGALGWPKPGLQLFLD